jgi:hypothetical protein
MTGTRKMTARMLVAALVAASMVVLPPLGAPIATAAPMNSEVTELEVLEGAPEELVAEAAEAASDQPDEPAAGPANGTAAAGSGSDPDTWQLSEPREVPGAVMVGLEVTGSEQPAAAVRYLEGEKWSGWVPLDFPDEDDGPDDGTGESRSARNATEPVWLGEAEVVQVGLATDRVSFDDVKLHTINLEGGIEFDPLAARPGAAEASNAPTVIARSAWDPNNDCAPRSSPSVASEARLAIIHHTAGSNNYTEAQAASQLRAICLYHRNANGWSDIGYNIVVDRFGRTYEGRAGGLERAVVGAHAANFNTGSIGVGVMGCFDSSCATALGSSALPSAALAAVDRAVAWRFAVHGIDPNGTIVLNSRTLDTIIGHRDVGSTSCPGDRFTPFVRGSNPMKTRVAALLAPPPPPPSPPRAATLPWHRGTVGSFGGRTAQGIATFDPGTGGMWVANPRNGSFEQSQWGRFRTRTGWQTHLSGDVTGNRRGDVISYHPSNGSWWVSRSDGSSFTSEQWGAFRTGEGWTAHLAGDFTGNGRTDVASFHPSNGSWWVNRSTGSSFVAERWGSYRTTTGWQTHLVGDFTGNKRDDILSFHPATGAWYLLRSTGSGFARYELWGNFVTRSGWGPHLVGDFNGDGRADVASYHAGAGTWWVSRSTGRSLDTTLWARFGTRTGWQVHLAGDVTGNRRADIVSYHPGTGNFWVSESDGRQFVGKRWMQFGTRTGWTRHALVDADGDGRADVASFHGELNGWWVSRSTGTHFSTSRW